MKNSKTSVRTLVMLALLTAMSIVFARVLTISTGFVRFNLGALPTHLAAVWFGPAGGFAVGALADLIGGILSGYSLNPLITLGAWACGCRSPSRRVMWWVPSSSTPWRCIFFTATPGRCWRPAFPTPSF